MDFVQKFCSQGRAYIAAVMCALKGEPFGRGVLGVVARVSCVISDYTLSEVLPPSGVLPRAEGGITARAANKDAL